MIEPPRIAKADILFLIKEQALANLRHTSVADVFFVVAALAIAVMALVLINITLLGGTLTLKRMTIPSFFVVIYITLMSLPAIVWFYASPADPIRYTYFLAIQSVLVTFPLGMFVANALFVDFSRPARIARQFMAAPLVKDADDRLAVRYWVLMLGLSIGVSVAYIATSPYVPLFGALTSYGEMAPSLVRRAIVAEGPVIHYGHALTARLLLPFCLIYSFFMAYQYGGRWRLLFWPTLATAAFVSALTLDRMFPFSVLLFLVLSVYFKYEDMAARAAAAGRRRRRGTSKVRLAIYVGALLFVSMLVGGIVSLTQFNKPIDWEIIKVTSTDFFVNRVLLDASYMAWIYFEEFNEPGKLLYGTSIHVVISWLFGIDFHPTISPSFVAELWVNFGWWGVVIGSLFVGFVLQFVQVKVFVRKTVPALSLFIIMALNGAWIIYGHLLATMVLSVYVPGILILVHLNRRRRAIAAARARLALRLQNVAAQ